VAILVIVWIFSKYSDANKTLYAEVFISGNGYGYAIKTKNKILIKQNFIPTIKGEKPFKTERDARLVSELIVNRMLKQKNPVITANDLDSLKISLNYQD
tara:strand:- start:406 stop:702 length:297 start_codon:yes stop_codon:yes gene_type:complete